MFRLEYIHQCNQSKIPTLLLKLDFEKTFDSIEHEAIIQIMQSKWFTVKWISWVNKLLSSGASSVFVEWGAWEALQV